MSYPTSDDQPQIFLSFASEDRKHARRLAGLLREHGIKSFVDEDSIAFGENVVLTIGNAVLQSDYYVLLWSRHTANRPWVDAEWTTALHMEVTERRGFVLVVRLDDSALPPLLRPRRYLDIADGWDTVAARLARTWLRDRGLGVPVLPPPRPGTAADAPDSMGEMELHLCNRTIPVAHVLVVPHLTTGAGLRDRAIVELGLPPTVEPLAGTVDARFRYRFEVAGRRIGDGRLVDQNVGDASLVDLLVTVEILGRGEIVTTWTLRGPTSDPVLPAGLSPATFDAIVAGCFKHLEPW